MKKTYIFNLLLLIVLAGFFVNLGAFNSLPKHNVVIPDSLKIGFEFNSWFGFEKYKNVEEEYVHVFESYFKTLWKKNNLSIIFYPGYTEERNKLKAIVKHAEIKYKLKKHTIAFKACNYSYTPSTLMFNMQINNPMYINKVDGELAFRGLHYTYNNRYGFKLGSNSWNNTLFEIFFKKTIKGFEFNNFANAIARDDYTNQPSFSYGLSLKKINSNFKFYTFNKFSYMLSNNYVNNAKKVLKTYTELGYDINQKTLVLASYYRNYYSTKTIDKQQVNFLVNQKLSKKFNFIASFENYKQKITGFWQNTYKSQLQYKVFNNAFVSIELGKKTLKQNNSSYFVGLQTAVRL